MKVVEEPAKQFVAETTRLMEATARPLIVAEVYECLNGPSAYQS
jgi:hypothetical protein